LWRRSGIRRRLARLPVPDWIVLLSTGIRMSNDEMCI
jgi:hypothetical protein